MNNFEPLIIGDFNIFVGNKPLNFESVYDIKISKDSNVFIECSLCSKEFSHVSIFFFNYNNMDIRLKEGMYLRLNQEATDKLHLKNKINDLQIELDNLYEEQHLLKFNIDLAEKELATLRQKLNI
jgi:hypothetical protein